MALAPRSDASAASHERSADPGTDTGDRHDVEDPPSTGGRHDVEDPPRRSRLAVLTVFVTFGIMVGSWLSRVPDVKTRLELGDAVWGRLGTVSALGSLAVMLLSTAIISRVGARRMSRITMLLCAGIGPSMAFAPEPLLLVIAMIAWSMSASALQPAANSAGVVVERAYARPIMSNFHAGWSLGALVGGLLGTLAARLGIAPGPQLLATNVVLVLALGLTTRWLPADEPVPAGVRAGPVFTAQLGLLAVLGFSSAIGEGIVSGWAGIYVNETLGAGAAAGALIFSCITASQLAGRLVGDRALQWLGHARFLRTIPLLGGLGLTAGLAVGTPAAAFVGFALVALGLSCVTPTVYGAAGNQPGIPSGQAIATLTIAAWPAFFAGPWLVGEISDATSQRSGLLVVVIATGVISLFARLAHFPTPGNGPSR